MGIKPLSASMPLSYISNPQLKRQASTHATANYAATATSVADRMSFSQTTRASAAPENKGDGNYDFTNISPNEMLSTINSLIKSGQMTLDESSSLLMLIPISTGGSDIQAATAANQKMNLFTALENMMAYDMFTHNDAAVIYDQKAISALKRFQGSHSGGG